MVKELVNIYFINKGQNKRQREGGAGGERRKEGGRGKGERAEDKTDELPEYFW